MGRNSSTRNSCLKDIKAVYAKLFQPCLTLCNTMECSLLDSSVHGILHARILCVWPCPSPGDLLHLECFKKYIVKSSDKTWSTGNGNSLEYSCIDNTVDNTKRQKDMKSEDESPSLEGVQYATGEEARAINNSLRRNEWLGKAEMTLSCGCVWWWK